MVFFVLIIGIRGIECVLLGPLLFRLDVRRGGLLPIRRLQGAPRLWWHPLSSQRVQVRQRKGDLSAAQILGQTAVPNLARAPQLLDDPERQ